MDNNRNKKLSLIQLLRALAILFVVIGHANILFHSKYGYDWFNMAEWERTGGVDFFFVLSGFMIYFVYYHQIGKRGKAARFFVKRVIRIIPLYWLATLASIALIGFYPAVASDQTLSFTSILSSMLLLPSEKILAVSWSLTHIMFFYIVFSISIIYPAVMKRLIFLWVFTTVALYLLDLPAYFVFSYSNLEIFMGTVAAYLILKVRVHGGKALFSAGLLGYLAIWINNIYSFIPFDIFFLYGPFALLITLGAAAIDKKEVVPVPKRLVYLGDASYSIFICHGPFVQFYLLLFGKLGIFELTGGFLGITALVVLSVLTSSLVYSFLERPMTNWLKNKLVVESEFKQVQLPVGKIS